MKTSAGQWYEIYIVVDGRTHGMGVTQAYRGALKDAKSLGGMVRRVWPKTVVK
jgi:hypothetical protein